MTKRSLHQILRGRRAWLSRKPVAPPFRPPVVWFSIQELREGA